MDRDGALLGLPLSQRWSSQHVVENNGARHNGCRVPHLPEGGEEVKVGDRTYVKFGETYYQPIQVDGKDMYEIVEVQPES